MMKKKMILADWEDMYLNELSYGFLERDSGLELFTFSDKEALYHYLRQGTIADILVVDESFVEPELQSLTSCPTKIVMSVSMNQVEGFEVIKKYQKNEDLLKAIMLRYAENSGSIEPIRGNSDTRMAVFYSPAGGTGKTTLALATATAGAKSGFRTFYLNMEEIDSVSHILRKTPGTLSDVFLALKTRGMNVGIKLQNCIGVDADAGFSYISGVESVSEYEEISGNDIKKLLETIRILSVFDLVVIDLSSGFTEKTKQLLNEVDDIFIPVTMNENSVLKLQRFFDESNLHRMYEPIMKKVKLIINQTGRNTEGRNPMADYIFERAVCCDKIPDLRQLSSYSGILKGNGNLISIMSTVIQMIMQKSV